MTGSNDMTSAMAAALSYPYEYGEYKMMEVVQFEDDILEMVDKFNSESVYVTLHLYTMRGMIDSFVNDISNDLALI